MKIKIDTPAYSFIKYKDDGSIDYISPVFCPFNYGSIPDTLAPDGDRLDAILLGKRISRGQEIEADSVGRVYFYDAGEVDNKEILSQTSTTSMERFLVKMFFALFSFAKKILNKAKGKNGRTYVEQIVWF